MHLFYESPGAGEYLRSLCWDDGAFCPRCRGERIYGLKDGRMRCGGCGYTFHDFCRRWIDRVKVGPSQWMKLIQAFAHMRTAQDTARELSMSYNAVHKAMRTIRLAIMADSGARRELGSHHRDGRCEDCGRCRQGGCDACTDCVFPVYAVNQSSLGVLLTRLRSVTPREVMGNPLAKRKWSVFLYTERFQVYDGLVFSCCKRGRAMCPEADGDDEFALDRQGGFWARAKEWLASYGNIDPLNYPLYIKECEFRFNHRGEDLVPLLASRLCRFVPECEH